MIGKIFDCSQGEGGDAGAGVQEPSPQVEPKIGWDLLSKLLLEGKT